MNPYKTAAYYTLGCKLNFSETSTIARNLQKAGYARVDFEHGADIYVINTCSVTENADRKCRNVIRRAKKHNPDAKIVIVGCYAQLKPEEITNIPGVNLVLGANEKFDVATYLNEIETNGKAVSHTRKISDAKTFFPSYSAGDRTRTFLKIQDGCDYFCTFCTIPLARGNSRSHNIRETVKVAHEVAATGVKEVVLTGVNTGDFGAGTNENFFQLMLALEETDIPRFRISSIEPNLLTDEIIAHVAQSKKFVPHFHIPLQTGVNRLLREMKRKYDTTHYAGRIRTIKELMPDAGIGVDVIVGFPGETDDDFLETYRFLNELPVSYLHVFTYSERPNTIASRMPGTVPHETRNERSKKLRILSEKKRRAFYESQIGRKATVLWEAGSEKEHVYGFTENYVKVSLPYDPARINTFEEVTIKGFGPEAMHVQPIEQLSV